MALLLDRLVDDLHQILLQSLFFKDQSVFVPDKVRHFGVPSVLFHASFKETKDVSIIGVLCELEFPAVVHEFFEFLWVPFAELVNSHLQLLLLNVIVFFVLRPAWQTLPRQTSSEKVEKHVANGLEVISPGLLVANMSVDTGITSCSRQVFPFSEGNMLSVRILIALCKPEIDDVDIVFGSFTAAYEKIVWLYVSVDYSLFVDFLDPLNLIPTLNYNVYHLNCNL